MNNASFVKQVKSEVNKVTWPGQKEVIYHSIVVLVLAIIMALFFLATDFIVVELVQFILNLELELRGV